MSDWVIRSKLAPPRFPRPPVKRERLAKRLALERRATVVHAPAGFGKTSLLAEFHHALNERAIPCAWLSLDDNDRDLVHFLRYLMEALTSSGLLPGAQLPSPPSGVAGASDTGRWWKRR